MKFIAELIAAPGSFAVSPDHGDEDHSTTSPALACSWLTLKQAENWINHHGSKWQPVEVK